MFRHTPMRLLPLGALALGVLAAPGFAAGGLQTRDAIDNAWLGLLQQGKEYQDIQQFRKSEKSFKDAIATAQKLGKDNFRVSVALLELARLYRDNTHQYAKARATYQQDIDLLTPISPHFALLVEDYKGIADVESKAGNPKAGLAATDRAVEILSKQHSAARSSDWSELLANEIAFNLALAHEEKARYWAQELEKLFDSYQFMRRKAGGMGDAASAISWRAQYLVSNQSLFEKLERLIINLRTRELNVRKDTLKKSKFCTSSDYTAMSNSICALGDANMALHNYDEAKRYYAKARLANTKLQVNPYDSYFPVRGLASIASASHNYSEEEKYLWETLEHVKSGHGATRGYVPEILNAMEVCYRNQKKPLSKLYKELVAENQRHPAKYQPYTNELERRLAALSNKEHCTPRLHKTV